MYHSSSELNYYWSYWSKSDATYRSSVIFGVKFQCFGRPYLEKYLTDFSKKFGTVASIMDVNRHVEFEQNLRWVVLKSAKCD